MSHVLQKKLKVSHSIQELDPCNFKNKTLSENEKLRILSQSTSYTDSYNFPATKGRKYSKDWEKTFPWLRYSAEEDSAYCSYCLIFGEAGGLFRTVGFNDWKNAVGEKRGTLKIHEKSKIHSLAKERAENLTSISVKRKSDVHTSISKAYEDRVNRNRQILLAIIDVLVCIGQRNIALRGNWDKAPKREDGNFQFFVDWRSQFDHVLREIILNLQVPVIYHQKFRMKLSVVVKQKIKKERNLLMTVKTLAFLPFAVMKPLTLVPKNRCLFVSDLLKIRISERNSLNLLN